MIRLPAELIRRLWAQVRLRPLVHALGTFVLLSTLLSAISSAAAYRAQHDAEDALAGVEAEGTERLLQVCQVINRNRSDARDLMQRGDLESGQVLIEIVSVGGTTPEEQAVLDAYQRLLAERQTGIVDEHAAEDLDCSKPDVALQLAGR